MVRAQSLNNAKVYNARMTGEACWGITNFSLLCIALEPITDQFLDCDCRTEVSYR